MLMRRTSPSTRIMGGRPADRCRSDALFLTENARSSAISIYVLPRTAVEVPTMNDWCSGTPHGQYGRRPPRGVNRGFRGDHEVATRCSPLPLMLSFNVLRT